jgi:hypothetical protein
MGHIAPGEYFAFQTPSPQWHQVSFTDDATSRVTSFVPMDETATAWDEKIIASQFKGAAKVGIYSMAQLFFGGEDKKCGKVITYVTANAQKNGYPSMDENEICTGSAGSAHISLYEFIQGKNDMYVTIWHLAGKKLDGANDAQKFTNTMLAPRSGQLWLNNIVCVVSDKDTTCPEWYTKSLAQALSAPKSP